MMLTASLIGAGALIIGGAAFMVWRANRHQREVDRYAEYLELMLVTTSDRYDTPDQPPHAGSVTSRTAEDSSLGPAPYSRTMH